ncbi:succinate dehydrogenase assembly factor 1A, mitochondrial isoform X2 [Phalaenopsis equestris]|nr:succinate dehydrogenase assembly factor 1A, mitochondrial isoform X2 [Phalaenopsis equestris]XP_020572732.1 succinate dehydrogenase assembly factor 1A, mitochondrial isoform X2 [Phalaenopsis equestris]XP_020572733.1 succinate dehydrogenase assembly factor 1A, mitochondrial isoform X2 [Phalaenopsis equestris]XP_020572734.1 succinate dehydrogenase assembly factor 1A, mitochondrial isoform X2 [Phalaenopsis equestris]
MVPLQKLSGMQRQVLALYRHFLRAARSKNLDERKMIISVVSTEFRHSADHVDRKNFQHIEYLLRRGRKQLEQLKSSTTISLSTINLNSSTSKTVHEDKKLA